MNFLRLFHIDFSEKEAACLAEEKNELYLEYIHSLSEKDIEPETRETLVELKRKGFKLAVGSSSKNAKIILKQIKAYDYFDVIIDYTDTTNAKPAPDIFLLAAERLGVLPESCIVVEDAISGIEAAHSAGMTAFSYHGSAEESGMADIDLSSMSEIKERIFPERS